MNHRVCPQCGSEHIDFDIGYITGKYRCLDCGYVGSVIFEFDDKNYEIFLKRLKEEK
jgi:transposase-like protein